MWIHNINPVLVTLFGLEIRYYGLAYVLGFLFGIWWLLRNRKEIGFSKDEVYDLMFYVMLGGVIGARLVHVFVWEPSYYLSNLLEILMFWKGGMAFHGGLLGGLLGGWLYHRKKKFRFLQVADLLSFPMLVAGALGRIANFINGELVGTATNVSWCVDFGDGCRHPVQLYSSLKRFAIAGIVLLVSRKKHKAGFVFFLTIMLLGLGRFFIDFLREDVLYFGLSMGQWSSALIFVIGLVVLVKWYRKDLTLFYKK